MKEINLLNRTFNFGINVIKFLRTLPDNQELKVIKKQLIKSATSIGANYEEAQAGFTKADFNHRVSIVLKQARETNYWLRVLEGLDCQDDHLFVLIQESKELKNIFGAIVIKGKSNE